MDMDDSSQVRIILRRPFLANIEAVIDMSIRRISFQLCKERVAPLIPTVPTVLATLMVPITPLVVSRIKVFDGDGIPQRKFSVAFESPSLILASFKGTSGCSKKVEVLF